MTTQPEALQSSTPPVATAAPTATPPKARKRSGVRALFAGLGEALQWRLLLLWIVSLLLPTAIVTLPVWRALAAQFDHSLQVERIAAGFEPMAMFGAIGNIGQSGAWFGGIGIGATVLALLLSPWLAGMVVASIRTGYPLGIAALVGGGAREYGRMLRTLLWSLLPLGIAFGIGAAAMAIADRQAADAILAADADRAFNIALGVAAVLLVLAHASVEAGRGVIASDAGRRSAVRAWGRGLMLLLRRPVATLLVYLGTALAGYGLALGFGLLRLQASGPGWLELVLGVVLTQLLVAAIAWGRSARLYAMADLARDEAARRPAKPRRKARVRKPRAPEPSSSGDDAPAPTGTTPAVEATVA
ncbi:MAG: hypothetical protein ACREPV_05270 [Lysobacter sp.]